MQWTIGSYLSDIKFLHTPSHYPRWNSRGNCSTVCNSHWENSGYEVVLGNVSESFQGTGLGLQNAVKGKGCSPFAFAFHSSILSQEHSLLSLLDIHRCTFSSFPPPSTGDPVCYCNTVRTGLSDVSICCIDGLTGSKLSCDSFNWCLLSPVGLCFLIIGKNWGSGGMVTLPFITLIKK